MSDLTQLQQNMICYLQMLIDVESIYRDEIHPAYFPNHPPLQQEIITTLIFYRNLITNGAPITREFFISFNKDLHIAAKKDNLIGESEYIDSMSDDVFDIIIHDGVGKLKLRNA